MVLLDFYFLFMIWLNSVWWKLLGGKSYTADREADGLPDLTSYISRETTDPIAHGSVSKLWKRFYRVSGSRMEVAVKSIRSNVVGDDSMDRTIEVVLCDCRERKQLKHENVLPLLGICYGFGPLPALVVPWMHNNSLAIYLERNFTELTLEQKLRILLEVAAGLSYLHSRGAVHGNLTANNILIDSTGTARIADHGIFATYSEFSGTSYITSNVRWAAPELFEISENEEPSHSSTPMPVSDIHALGCIILQVMTNQLPYASIRSNNQVAVMILKGEKPARRSSNSPIEDSVWDLIEKCWGRPKYRPTAIEVLHSLQSKHSVSLESIQEVRLH
ncbi:kinase-like domain-containing protein [Suillus ampliporus]|nr:kinase-like domain-containing protein [Suillus ampliporus]